LEIEKERKEHFVTKRFGKVKEEKEK